MRTAAMKFEMCCKLATSKKDIIININDDNYDDTHQLPVPAGLLIRSYITLERPGNFPISGTVFGTSSEDKSLPGAASNPFMKSCGILSS